MDPFDEFIDNRGYYFSLVQDPFESTTISVDPLDKFIGAHGSPFSWVRVPSGYIIACCEQYIQPSSIHQTHVNAFFWKIIDDYYTSTLESFQSALAHVLLTALILRSLLLQNYTLIFDHGLTFGSFLIFQVELYIYRHPSIFSFFLLFMSWDTLDTILEVINYSPLLLTNKSNHYQQLYGIWC